MTSQYDEIYYKGDQNSYIADDGGILFTHYARNKQIALTHYCIVLLMAYAPQTDNVENFQTMIY